LAARLSAERGLPYTRRQSSHTEGLLDLLGSEIPEPFCDFFSGFCADDAIFAHHEHGESRELGEINR
jgi:hypothetical protein